MKKRWLLLVTLVHLLWLAVSRFTELRQLRATLAAANWPWLLAAVVAQIIYYVTFAGTYQAAFYTAGIPARIRDLLPLTLSALFVNVVKPDHGISGGGESQCRPRGHLDAFFQAKG